MMAPMFGSMFKGLGKPSSSLELNVNSLDSNQNPRASPLMQADGGMTGSDTGHAARSKNVPELLDASFRNIPTP